MIVWPSDLVTDIARRTCVLYLGAGVSANAKDIQGNSPPTWKDFLLKAAEQIQEDRDYFDSLLSENDMLGACEVIINRIGNHKFNEIAQDCFRRPGFNHAEIHEMIYNLDSRLVITPNVDKIYDQYASNVSSGTIVIKKQTETDIPNYIRSQDRVILKAHGSIDTPNEMVFSKHQYNEARYKYSGFYRLLDSLVLTHTFIFIGCGLSDPDIRLTLENYNFGFPGCRPHYFITAKESTNEDIVKILRNNCNITVLQYSNTDGNHRNLVLSLKTLIEKVEEERSRLSGNQNW